MKTINGFTLEQIKAGFEATAQEMAHSIVKTYTVDEMIAALQEVAKQSPQGGNTRVRIGDWEGNLSAHGIVETLEIKYDPATAHVTIYCDPHEG